MERYKIVCAVVLILMTNFSYAISDPFSANQEVLNANGAELATELHSKELLTRYNALHYFNANIDKIALTDEIVNAIFYLADREIHLEESRQVKGELGAEYYNEIASALGNTKDARAINYLLGYFYSEPMATRGLVKIGEQSIMPVINTLQSDLVGLRSAAANTLSDLLKNNKAGEIDKKAIKSALIKELKNKRNDNPDKDIEYYEFRARERAHVRMNIAKALGHLAEEGDQEALSIIKSLAENDPYVLDLSRKKDYTGPRQRHLVREEAQKVLDRIKTKKNKKDR